MTRFTVPRPRLSPSVVVPRSVFAGTALVRSALILAVVAASNLFPTALCGVARADWADNVAGNQLHNPPGGSWGFAGLTLEAVPQTISGWTPQLAGERIVVPSPASPGGVPMFLAAGWIGSTSGTTHHYQNVRVGGSVAVGDNGGPGNNNLIGLLARANDYDSYVLAVNYADGSINLVKSRNADAANPTYITTEAISGFAPLKPFYLQMDVQDIAGGTRLVGRVYEDESRSNLLNTIFAFDDAGGAVPGAPHPPFYSGWVVQYNNLTPTGTTIDASFDNMSSTTLRPGDVNLDGAVNRADAAQLAQYFGMMSGAAWDEGDMDGNGRVDLDDLAMIQTRMTGGAIIVPPPIDAVAAAAVIPEPGGVTLVALGIAAAGWAIRRRRVALVACPPVRSAD